MHTYLILGATYAFAAAVQPGQFQAYLISQSLANGWRRTVPASLAPIVSDVPIIFLVLVVLTHLPALLLHVLQLAGGLFLLYLAAGAFKAWRRYQQAKARAAPSTRKTILRAALVNFLNPSPYLGWSLVMGPLLLKGWRQAPANGIALVGAFYLTMVISTAGIIILFSAARSLGPRVARVLVGVSAVALMCFGLYQLWSGGRPLLRHAVEQPTQHAALASPPNHES